MDLTCIQTHLFSGGYSKFTRAWLLVLVYTDGAVVERDLALVE